MLQSFHKKSCYRFFGKAEHPKSGTTNLEETPTEKKISPQGLWGGTRSRNSDSDRDTAKMSSLLPQFSTRASIHRNFL